MKDGALQFPGVHDDNRSGCGRRFNQHFATAVPTNATENRYTIHDFHTTVLHLDHTPLTFRKVVVAYGSQMGLEKSPLTSLPEFRPAMNRFLPGTLRPGC